MKPFRISVFFAIAVIFVLGSGIPAADGQRWPTIRKEPPLSTYGLNYSLVHRVHAVRDATCDESLWQMRSLQQQQRQSHVTPASWKYALECPISDLDRRQARLRCYRTTSDDYEKTLHEPTNEIPY